MIRLDEFASAKFIRFLVAGGLAALANIASRALLSRSIDYIPAIVIAYLIGMATAYFLNRMLVFGKGDRRVHEEMGYFALVNVLAIAQTIVVSAGLAWYVLPAIGIQDHAETIAHIVGVITPIFTSFLGHKHWTFRNHARP